MLKNKNKHVVKRATKDTVFSDLFSIPKYRKELYLALHPKVKDVDESDIKTVTLNHVITNGVVNDLSITVSDVLMILVEAQSTWNKNMPLRMLEYLIESINQYLNVSDQQILSSKKVHLPNIELYVVYTGDRRVKDKNVKIYGYTKQSIKKTIDECVKHNILREYLKMRKKEVNNIMSSRLWDQDAIIEEMKRVKEKEAEKRGMKAGELGLLVSLVNENLLTLEQACKKAKMSRKNFKALLPA